MNYTGEHLIWGNIGHLSVALAFGASLLAAFSFFMAARNESPEKLHWYKTGRTAFWLHSAGVLGIIIALFGIIYNHYFEYYYAWRHSSLELPVEYMISCFWEGQEGSFLLWMFWHVVLGNVMLGWVNKWTSPVMTMVALCQVVLSSMLLGVEIFGHKFGSSPFDLLRQTKDMGAAPIFSQLDYLSKYIKDGNGLNPLLQNYWMVIHPPVLFLGFASTIIPFGFAIAGLWTKNYKEWIKPALPWALFGVMVLGTGIIMGGMWAYESLSFGGYWAWDPVENASLIPWLILVAGLHTMLINKSTGHSVKSTFILITGSFLLVLYATFLTRSGILGESSVHSFTDLGLSGQLLIFLGMFVLLTLYLILSNWRKIPSNKEEQSSYSREFWMFIGALVLLLSAGQILFTTSFPVFNKVFGTNLAPPTDVIGHYNSIQMPIAIIVALLTGMTQYFKYIKTDKGQVLKQLILYAGIALLAGLGGFFFWELYDLRFAILLFAAMFGMIANVAYIITVLKKKWTFSGASVAHIGFGMMMLGVLVSAGKKEVVSINQSGETFFDTKNEANQKANVEHVLLMRDKPITMGAYTVEYKGDSVEEPNHYFKVDYTQKDANGAIKEQFRLYPNLQLNPKMGNVFNPDTRHYLTSDLFTHVSAVPEAKMKGNKAPEEQAQWGIPESFELNIGDTAFTSANHMLILEGLKNNKELLQSEGSQVSLMMNARIRVVSMDQAYISEPAFAIQNNRPIPTEALLDELGMKLQMTNIDFMEMLNTTGKKKLVSLSVSYRPKTEDYIIMKAIKFPYINLLWLGTIIMVLGSFMAMVRRAANYRGSRLV